MSSFQTWAWFLTQNLSEGEDGSLGVKPLEYHGNVYSIDSSSPSQKGHMTTYLGAYTLGKDEHSNILKTIGHIVQVNIDIW